MKVEITVEQFDNGISIKWKHVDATTEYQYVDLTSVNRENRNIFSIFLLQSE